MLKIVETGNKFGTMNTGTMPKELSRDEKLAKFKEHRMAVGNEYGFDWHKMFMADQVDKKGTYFEITEDYVETNPNGWTDINQDILIITDKLPGVVIGHPVADCPVVIMQDVKQNVCAIAHCSAELIDKKMPMMIAEALLDAYKSKDEDIIAYISACAGPDWTYNVYPKWATDRKMWESGIEVDDNGIFHINIRKVINNQLRERNISNIQFNMDDTITNPNYYSNCAASPYGLNDPTKYGRNFSGAFYKVKKMR